MEGAILLQFFGILIIAIFGLKILINWWWFQIDRRVRYQKMQNNLLIELCKKQGVDSDRLSEIIDEYNG